MHVKIRFDPENIYKVKLRARNIKHLLVRCMIDAGRNSQKWTEPRLCSFYKVEVFKFLIKNLSKVVRFLHM